MPEKPSEYTTISIPTQLAELIDKRIETDPRGFRNRSEFVTYATRSLLEQNNGGGVGGG